MEELLRANIDLLDQALALLGRLPRDNYAKPSSILHSSVGGHMRHCLDHYECYLQGLPNGRVDYDARRRDPALETDLGTAVDRIQSIQTRLAESVRTCQPISISIHHGAEPSTWQQSTTSRECIFLFSHTIHHYALIAGICREQGVEVPAEFGVAPSTLKHRQESTAHSS